MFKAQTFYVDAEIESVTFQSESASWHFKFTKDVFLAVNCFWRLLDAGSIIAISDDQGAQFGFGVPLDLATLIQQKLENESLDLVNVKAGTGDLLLTFSNNKAIEVLITSVGYENYDFQFEGRRHIAVGGDLAVVTS